MPDDIKKTKGVSKMREVLAEIVESIEGGELNTTVYCPLTCDTCIHKHKAVTDSPCNKCTTATEDSGRDHKPSDQFAWEPDLTATPQQIRTYHTFYGIKDFRHYQLHPPVRCINPSCKHGFPGVYDRGLCKSCYHVLLQQVEIDAEQAENWSFIHCLSDSDTQREFAMEIYLSLNTWDRFIMLGLCLPNNDDFEAEIPDRELILYYRQARLNKSRGATDPTPTIKQLRKCMTAEQLSHAMEYLVIRG